MQQVFAVVVVVVLSLGILVVGAPASGANRYVQTSDGSTPAPVVAVDNVCAWPNLTVLQDGAIAAAIFNQPSHGGVEGDVECWVTQDGGSTWRRAGIVAPHEPATNRMNVAAGRAQNGDLIVIASGWSNRYPAGSSGPAFRAAVLAPWLCRSVDGGRRWSIDRSGLPQRAPDGHRWIPYGDILQADDGALRTAVYSWPGAGPRNERAWCIESVDDGKTWGRFRPLDRDQLRNETALLNLGGRHWLAVARQSALYGYASDDGGKSWRTLGPITDEGQHPAHLLQLRDNRVLLSYGDRTGSKHAVQVVVSSDAGNTWSEPLRVVDWWGDGGYPSSVQRPDGQIVTAYYAARTAGHERYHMGVVIWDPVRSLGAAK